MDSVSLSALTGALLAGLLGGAHCLAMCGGFVAAMSGAGIPPSALGTPLLPARALARRQLPYNLGRITTYAALGAIAGGVGAAALGTGEWPAVQRALYVIANLFLLALAVAIAGRGSSVEWLQRVGAAVFSRIVPGRAAARRAQWRLGALRARHDLGARPVRARLQRAADRALRRQRACGRARHARVRTGDAAEPARRGLARHPRAIVARRAVPPLWSGDAARRVRRTRHLARAVRNASAWSRRVLLLSVHPRRRLQSAHHGRRRPLRSARISSIGRRACRAPAWAGRAMRSRRRRDRTPTRSIARSATRLQRCSRATVLRSPRCSRPRRRSTWRAISGGSSTPRGAKAVGDGALAFDVFAIPVVVVTGGEGAADGASPGRARRRGAARRDPARARRARRQRSVLALARARRRRRDRPRAPARALRVAASPGSPVGPRRRRDTRCRPRRSSPRTAPAKASTCGSSSER